MSLRHPASFFGVVVSVLLFTAAVASADVLEAWQSGDSEPLQLAYSGSTPALPMIASLAVTASDGPRKPIARTIIGPSLLTAGVIPTTLGIVLLAGGAAASGSDDSGEVGDAVGAGIAILGGVMVAIGAGFIIPGTIVTVKAVRGWREYRAAKQSSYHFAPQGLEINVGYAF